MHAQDITLEPLVIERNRYSFYLKDSRYFSFDQDQPYPVNSPEEVLDYSSSLDLRKRGAFGLQQDVSLRGSIFEDASISLAGVTINDPQTGHFTLELPLTSADLQAAHILKNSQQIAFYPRPPQTSGGIIATSFGQHALWEELSSVNFGLGQVANRVSVEHKSSLGDRQDTDFDIYNLSSHSLWKTDQNEVELLVGSTIRDFGAANFYAKTFPNEKEHLTQQFYLLRNGLKGDNFNYNATMYLRRHTDEFILNRDNPAFYTNHHKTYVYGLRNDIDLANDSFVSLDLERESINSSNLKKHTRQRQGFSLGIKEKRIDDFIFDLASGLDYYKPWNYLENGHAGLGYFLTDSTKLRFGFDHIWRAPSFTELYYVSPTDIGNPSLGIQRSNNYELGVDIAASKTVDLSVSTFLRDQSNTLDWVKNVSGDPWQATNVGTVKAYGLDVYSRANLQQKFLKYVSLGYTYLELDKDSPYAFSKYVFDYDRHKLVSDFGFEFAGVSLNTIASFSKPPPGGSRKKYATVDLKAVKNIGDVSISLEGTNIFNAAYQELTDIEGSARWYKLSLAYSF